MRQAIHPERETDVDVVLRESFEKSAFKSDYAIVAPKLLGALARWEDEAIVLAMPADGDGEEIIARRKFDVSSARGMRIRVRARLRTDCSVNSFARATINVLTPKTGLSYHENASTSTSRASQWIDVHTVIDVPPDAISGQLDLILHGKGTAWFKEVEITRIGRSPTPTPIKLSPQQISNLVTFSRAAALIRYLHPSDQASTLDWNTFLPAAIGQLLKHAPSPSDLARDLRLLFKEIAPTVIFVNREHPIAPTTMPSRGAGTHLVRWRRHGFNKTVPYREGRDADNTFASALTRLPFVEMRSCKNIILRVTGQSTSSSGKSLVVMRIFQSPKDEQETVEPWHDSSKEVRLAASVPDKAQAIEVGLRVEGGASAKFDTMTVSCDGNTFHGVDIEHASWTLTDFTELYTWDISRCDERPCASLQRRPLDTRFVPDRDMLQSDIGSGIEMQMPLAVWADAGGTLPSVPQRSPLSDFAIDDSELRIAAIVAAWGTLSVFYPYFADQHTDWLATLAPAIEEAAAARSPVETRIALCRLNARLQDNHGRVSHPGAPFTGILPISLRRFDRKIIINGGVPEYLRTISIGSELLEVQGVPADKAYDQMALQVPGATAGLHEYLMATRMLMGTPGEFWSLRIRARDGSTSDHLMPLVDYLQYFHANREPKPPNGTELSPGIYYLDLDALSAATWNGLLSKFERAQVIILDFRGYGTNVVYEVMSHITDRELDSPLWQTPLIPNIAGMNYANSQWHIFPQKPRLKAKIIMLIDGRSMSAVETDLQIFREHQLGLLVGETSAGANGNVGYIDLPGGFQMRFTALRASSRDGTTIHGRGFTPDYVVHPTLEGVQAGRDEILEASVKIAQGLLKTP